MKTQPDVRNLADPLDAIDILEAQLAEVTDQRDELLAAAKEARMALTLDYHGCTKPKKALCEVSGAAYKAHLALHLAITKCS